MADTTCIKKSLAQFKRHSNTKIQKVADWLKDNADIETMADFQQKALQRKLDEMIAQVKRYETCLEDNSPHLISEDSKLEDDKKNYDTLSDELEEVMEAMDKVEKDANAFMKQRIGAVNNTVTGAIATSTSSSKIDDTLKPSETLLRSMSLEEFNVWSDQFEAYYKQNERIFAGLDVSVRRAVFFKSKDD